MKDEELLLLKKCNAPSGSKCVRIPRDDSLIGGALQTVCALIFSSYFFLWPFFGSIWLLLGFLEWVSWTHLGLVAIAYFLQIGIYKPHLTGGWSPIWLHVPRFTALVDNVQGYHDGTLIREGPQPDEEHTQYMFAMYPHGIFGVCRAYSGGTAWRQLYGSITARWGSFGAAFYWPGVREFSLWAGCLDASKPVLKRAIASKENIMLLPGGIKEMIMTDSANPDTKIVTLDRKGYAKLAIEEGLAIVPGFCFGEKRIHSIVHFPQFLQDLMLKCRLSPCFLIGRWGCTFLGEPLPLGMVWGKPIPTEKMDAQDPRLEAQLERIHAEVEVSVHDIFQRYKAHFGYCEDETLTSVASGEFSNTRDGEDKKRQ